MRASLDCFASTAQVQQWRALPAPPRTAPAVVPRPLRPHATQPRVLPATDEPAGGSTSSSIARDDAQPSSTARSGVWVLDSAPGDLRAEAQQQQQAEDVAADAPRRRAAAAAGRHSFDAPIRPQVMALGQAGYLSSVAQEVSTSGGGGAAKPTASPAVAAARGGSVVNTHQHSPAHMIIAMQSGALPWLPDDISGVELRGTGPLLLNSAARGSTARSASGFGADAASARGAAASAVPYSPMRAKRSAGGFDGDVVAGGGAGGERSNSESLPRPGRAPVGRHSSCGQLEARLLGSTAPSDPQAAASSFAPAVSPHGVAPPRPQSSVDGRPKAQLDAAAALAAAAIAIHDGAPGASPLPAGRLAASAAAAAAAREASSHALLPTRRSLNLHREPSASGARTPTSGCASPAAHTRARNSSGASVGPPPPDAATPAATGAAAHGPLAAGGGGGSDLALPKLPFATRPASTSSAAAAAGAAAAALLRSSGGLGGGVRSSQSASSPAPPATAAVQAKGWSKQVRAVPALGLGVLLNTASSAGSGSTYVSPGASPTGSFVAPSTSRAHQGSHLHATGSGGHAAAAATAAQRGHHAGVEAEDGSGGAPAGRHSLPGNAELVPAAGGVPPIRLSISSGPNGESGGAGGMRASARGSAVGVLVGTSSGNGGGSGRTSLSGGGAALPPSALGSFARLVAGGDSREGSEGREMRLASCVPAGAPPPRVSNGGAARTSLSGAPLSARGPSGGSPLAGPAAKAPTPRGSFSGLPVRSWRALCDMALGSALAQTR